MDQTVNRERHAKAGALTGTLSRLTEAAIVVLRGIILLVFAHSGPFEAWTYLS